MKYVLIALCALAALEVARGQFGEAILCLVIASGSIVDQPVMIKRA